MMFFVCCFRNSMNFIDQIRFDIFGIKCFPFASCCGVILEVFLVRRLPDFYCDETPPNHSERTVYMIHDVFL